MKQRKILPSITTHQRSSSGWRNKIEELVPLGISEAALFLTGVAAQERTALYHELERARSHHVFTLPFVHAVSDMQEDEYDYLSSNFGTELFNLHPSRQFPLLFDLSQSTRDKITIENAFIDEAITLDDLRGFNGICLDVSHAEDLRRKNPAEFDKLVSMLSLAPIRANHISAVYPVAALDSNGHLAFHSHLWQGDDCAVGYLKSCPLEFFGELISIELANSLAEQQRFIPLIERLLEQKQVALLPRMMAA